MATKVKVKAIGHGSGYNRYLIELEFRMNNEVKDYDNESAFISVCTDIAIRKAKSKSACDYVTIQSIDIKGD